MDRRVWLLLLLITWVTLIVWLWAGIDSGQTCSDLYPC